jgi:hypothetical protein
MNSPRSCRRCPKVRAQLLASYRNLVRFVRASTYKMDVTRIKTICVPVSSARERRGEGRLSLRSSVCERVPGKSVWLPSPA